MSEDQLAVLLAEREILQIMGAFCRALDRFDAEAYRSVWHDDSTLELPGEKPVNALGLTDFFTRDHADTVFYSHQFTNPTTRIAGDRAASESYLYALMRRSGESAGQWVDTHNVGARFLDRWSRRNGRWAIDHRRILPGARWTRTVTDGEDCRLSRRDRTDPSYEPFRWLDSFS
ncbi:nuclear transport factor 2 family protein [Streptomyces sp. NPDC051985]|uniref:nuclear transport factor 2 family protein n=1 Tax=Streptomyces sp. NPDC051985 TaxID=3155807 RepID=UPI0034428027